jgi:hypothetical protein
LDPIERASCSVAIKAANTSNEHTKEVPSREGFTLDFCKALVMDGALLDFESINCCNSFEADDRDISIRPLLGGMEQRASLAKGSRQRCVFLSRPANCNLTRQLEQLIESCLDTLASQPLSRCSRNTLPPQNELRTQTMAQVPDLRHLKEVSLHDQNLLIKF